MRVLIVTSHEILEDKSGTPKHINKIVASLSARNIDICVVHLDLRTKFSFKVIQKEYQGFTVFNFPFLMWVTESKKLIDNFRPDAFFAFTNGAACRFLPLLWMHNIPLLYEVHTVFSPFLVRSWVSLAYSQLEKIVCKRASHIVVLGEEVRDIYRQKRNVSESKLSVIYPGVAIEKFRAISDPPKKTYKKDGQVNVTYLGNLVFDNHGIDYLLKAARIVGEKNKSIHFYLVGKPDGAEEIYKDLRSPEDRVTFVYTDEINQIDQILADADILVHTRIYSRHNLSVQSKFAVYMACGKPVVVTNFADYKIFVDSYKCGYAVGLEPKEIASAILGLANRSDLRQTMGRNSLELAKTHFDLEHNIDRYIDILERIVA